MDTEVFEVAPGQWGYRVGGVYQEWTPGADGFVPMTKEQAEQFAAEVAARMTEG